MIPRQAPAPVWALESVDGGGIGVGGIRGHNADEDLAKIGLQAMGL